MKFDFCIWGKNGARVLPAVLKRIDQVIPPEAIGQKIFVDDSSVDNTTEIAASFNWTIYPNRQTGVCGGFNEALKQVKTRFFMSFEQDVILSRDWFKTVTPYLEFDDVAVVQGIRVPSNPIMEAIYREKLNEGLNDSQLTSLDNNVWRTDVIKKIGGLPKDKKFVADRYLYPKVLETRYRWVIIRDLMSIHIREGLTKSVNPFHNALMRAQIEQAQIEQPTDKQTLKDYLNYFVEGCFRAGKIAFKYNLPFILVAYPYTSVRKFKSLWNRKKFVMVRH